MKRENATADWIREARRDHAIFIEAQAVGRKGGKNARSIIVR
jgi:hypothetical protein